MSTNLFVIVNPVSHILEAVYKTLVDWINKRSTEALRAFFLWSLDSIFADLANQQGVTKGSKKGGFVHSISNGVTKETRCDNFRITNSKRNPKVSRTRQASTYHVGGST
nr:transmembrane protein 214-like [Tanacetum cinerariifolium]